MIVIFFNIISEELMGHQYDTPYKQKSVEVSVSEF